MNIGFKMEAKVFLLACSQPSLVGVFRSMGEKEETRQRKREDERNGGKSSLPIIPFTSPFSTLSIIFPFSSLVGYLVIAEDEIKIYCLL